MPTAITQRDRITASANLDISEMDGVVQVKSRPSETSGFSYARPRYRNPKKNGPKKLFGNRLCSKNLVWPWKPNKIRIFVSSPIIGSNWKDIYHFIYLPFHLFVSFIIDYLYFFSDCFFWYRASYNTESRLLLLDQSVCFYSVFSVLKSKQKLYQQPIVAREVSWGTNENSK